MAKKASKRRQWTKEDIRELKASARHKTPARKIARSLKRTEGATRQKAFSLGLSLDKKNMTPPDKIIFASPAKSKTSVQSWVKAFEK